MPATAERLSESLTRAATGQTMTNYPAIFAGFTAKGIPEADIRPRENVFTYNAWRALGRQVRKGEHGVRIITFLSCKPKEGPEDGNEGKRKPYSRPWTTTVFHVSQTDPIP